MTPNVNPARRPIADVGPRPYIEEKCQLRVRFNEVDALHVVWHGHYVNYFEEGRRALGRKLGVDYTTFLDNRIAVPVVHIDLNFLAPARLPDTLEITTHLLKPVCARLDFNYEIRRVADSELLATGSSSQVFTTPAGELLLSWPPMMLERLKSWESLWKNP